MMQELHAMISRMLFSIFMPFLSVYGYALNAVKYLP